MPEDRDQLTHVQAEVVHYSRRGVGAQHGLDSFNQESATELVAMIIKMHSNL